MGKSNIDYKNEETKAGTIIWLTLLDCNLTYEQICAVYSEVERQVATSIMNRKVRRSNNYES